jgi:hypothetical protein
MAFKAAINIYMDTSISESQIISSEVINNRLVKDLTKTGLLDKLGATLSLACALHCALLPVLIVALPMLGLSFLTWHGFEHTIIVITLSLALLSVVLGCRIHGLKRLLGLPFLALILFLVALSSHEPLTHALFSTSAGLCLVAAHLINRKLCKSCLSCCKNS